MDYFNFDEWFQSLVSIDYIHDKFDHALLDIVSNGLDISSYKVSNTLIPNNLLLIQQDKNDKYFVEVQLSRNSNDLSTGFMAYPFYGSENSSIDFIISLKIGNDIVPINAGTKIVISCAMYTEFNI